MTKRLSRDDVKRNKRWSPEEVDKIFQFIRKNPFELPTGTMYYKKMAQDLKLNSNHTVVRCKVNNLIKSYKRAKALIATNKQFPMAEVLKACPYYRQLHELFKKSLPGRRNTICAGSQISARHPKLDGDGAATDIDESIADCWASSPRFMVQLPAPANADAPLGNLFKPACVKKEHVPSSPAFSKPTEIALSSIQAPSEQIAPPQIDEPMLTESTTVPQQATPSESSAEQEETTQARLDISNTCADCIIREITEIDVSSTAALSTETESQDEPMVLANPTITVQQGTVPTETDFRLMELRLREKELDIKMLDIKANERLERLKLESKERIVMRKLDLKYAKK